MSLCPDPGFSSTGKFAGITGGGTYGGSGTNDGGTVNVTGHYTIVAAKGRKTK